MSKKRIIVELVNSIRAFAETLSAQDEKREEDKDCIALLKDQLARANAELEKYRAGPIELTATSTLDFESERTGDAPDPSYEKDRYAQAARNKLIEEHQDILKGAEILLKNYTLSEIKDKTTYDICSVMQLLLTLRAPFDPATEKSREDYDDAIAAMDRSIIAIEAFHKSAEGLRERGYARALRLAVEDFGQKLGTQFMPEDANMDDPMPDEVGNLLPHSLRKTYWRMFEAIEDLCQVFEPVKKKKKGKK